MADKGTETVYRRQRKQPGKRKKKKRHPVLAFFIILIVLVLVGVFGFQTKDIQITGNERVTDDKVKELIQCDKSYGNTLILWLINRKIDISSEPLLLGIRLSIENPQKVVVHVREQQLVAAVKNNDQYSYVNEKGRIILTQDDKIPDIPMLDGIQIKSAENGDVLTANDDTVLDSILNIAALLNEEEIIADTIGITSDGGYDLVMGRVTVLLGKDIYMEEKLSELKDLLPNLDGLSGTLHLEEYDSTKDSIIFTKDS